MPLRSLCPPLQWLTQAVAAKQGSSDTRTPPPLPCRDPSTPGPPTVTRSPHLPLPPGRTSGWSSAVIKRTQLFKQLGWRGELSGGRAHQHIYLIEIRVQFIRVNGPPVLQLRGDMKVKMWRGALNLRGDADGWAVFEPGKIWGRCFNWCTKKKTVFHYWRNGGPYVVKKEILFLNWRFDLIWVGN